MCMLNSFSNNKNEEVSKKIEFLLQKIKDKVLFDVFDDNTLIKEVNENFKNIDSNHLLKKLEEELDNEKRSNSNYGLELIKNKLDSSIKIDINFEWAECENSNLKQKKISIRTISQEKIKYLFEDIFKDESFSEILQKLKLGLKDNTIDLQVPPEKMVLRKNLCVQMFKIFEKILENFEPSEIKKLIILLERKIRERDVSMGSIYRREMTSFFKKIENILGEDKCV